MTLAWKRYLPVALYTVDGMKVDTVLPSAVHYYLPRYRHTAQGIAVQTNYRVDTEADMPTTSSPASSAWPNRSKVAVLNTKGGVGKTTTAMLLCTAAARDSHTVELWDADPQGSASEWFYMAEEAGTPFPFQVATVNKITIKRESGADLAVIDGPPGESSTIQAAIDCSDLIIIPTTTSPLDVMRTWRTLETTGDKPTMVVLTSVKLGTKLLEQARAAFEEEGVYVARSVIPHRESLKQSIGQLPLSMYGYDSLYNEIVGLMSDDHIEQDQAS